MLAAKNGAELANIANKATSRAQAESGPPPDRGLRAWTQVIVAHLIVFNSWGYIQSFGVFQTYYVTALNHTPSDIAWVGSLQLFFIYFVGTFSGRATDYGLFRVTCLTGSMFQLLGIFMTSLSTRYWQLLLAQGVCTGLGSGLIFCPTVSVLSTYFSKKRSLALGIAASGSATGGLVYPVIIQQLLPKIGFPWTVRVLGFVMFTLQIVALIFTRSRLPPRRSGPLVEWRAFKELPYTLYSAGTFLVFWGLYIAFYYIGFFGRNVLGISQKDSINNLLIVNGVGLVSRLVAAYLADHFFGPLNVLLPAALVSGLLLYCWATVESDSGLVAFSAIYGLSAAAIQGLFPATLASLTADLGKAGIRMGMVFTIVSFASLTGPPLAGALIQRRNGDYLYAQMFAGSVLMGGCAVLFGARVAKLGWKKGRV